MGNVVLLEHSAPPLPMDALTCMPTRGHSMPFRSKVLAPLYTTDGKQRSKTTAFGLWRTPVEGGWPEGHKASP